MPSIEDFEKKLQSVQEESRIKTRNLESALSTISLLYQVNSELSQIEDADELYRVFLEKILRLFAAEIGIFYKIDKVSGEYAATFSLGIQKKEQEGLHGSIILTALKDVVLDKKVAHLSSAEALGGLAPIFKKYGTVVSMLAPVETDNGIIAVMQCSRLYNEAFTTEEERVLRILLNKLSLTLDVIATKKRLKEKTRELEETKEKIEQTVIERTLELREEQARLLASINSLSFGFIIADMNHNVILKNKAMIDMFGWAEEEKATIEKISSSIGGGFDVRLEVEKCLKTAKVCEIKEILFGGKFLKGVIAPVGLTDANNGYNAIGYVFLLEDITEAKVIERSREEFFAVASHELRTPLTVIRGNSEMIQDIYKDKIIDKDMAEMISDIHESSIRLISIVNDFLDTSRLEQGRIAFQKKSVDLVTIVEETCREMEPLAKAKNLSLSFAEPGVALPPVLTDPVRIKQVLSNIIDNAIKYTDKGGVSITIEPGGDFSTVYISDTGQGISPKNQTLLFRKFQQAGEVQIQRDVSTGTGLGLYISKLIIEAMGGTISLQKSSEEGSTFKITVPQGK